MRRSIAARRSCTGSCNPRYIFLRQVKHHHLVAIFVQEERKWTSIVSLLVARRHVGRLHRSESEIDDAKKRTTEVTAT
jgi:hypothetical protein